MDCCSSAGLCNCLLVGCVTDLARVDAQNEWEYSFGLDDWYVFLGIQKGGVV